MSIAMRMYPDLLVFLMNVVIENDLVTRLEVRHPFLPSRASLVRAERQLSRWRRQGGPVSGAWAEPVEI